MSMMIEQKNNNWKGKVESALEELDHFSKDLKVILKDCEGISADKDSINSILIRLEDYSRAFQIEYELMQMCDASDKVDYLKQQLTFVEKIAQLRFESLMDNSTIKDKLILFVKKWLVSHVIQGNDNCKRQVTEFLKTVEQ